MADNPMTAEELEALKAELEQLEGQGRAEIAEQIKIARGWGDLKENAEYHAAKEAQGHLETRIARLRERLNHAVVVDSTGGDAVAFGSTVELRDEATGDARTYTLVSSLDADARSGKLSMDSPVAQALRGKKPGDVAAVETLRGTRAWRVVSVA